MKIMIIGSSGSGKSTFARELGKITSYPILHLDKVFHKYPSEIAREKLREATRIFIFQNDTLILGLHALANAPTEFVYFLRLSFYLYLNL